MLSSSYYKSRLRDSERELKDYKKRRDQLEDIKNNYSGFYDKASDLNDHVNKAISYIQSAITSTSGSVYTRNLPGTQDTGIGDENLYNSKEYIKSELNRVNGKIEELQNRIGTLENNLKEAKRIEKEERDNK